jgi:hypothetical protein
VPSKSRCFNKTIRCLSLYWTTTATLRLNSSKTPPSCIVKIFSHFRGLGIRPEIFQKLLFKSRLSFWGTAIYGTDESRSSLSRSWSRPSSIGARPSKSSYTILDRVCSKASQLFPFMPSHIRHLTEGCVARRLDGRVLPGHHVFLEPSRCYVGKEDNEVGNCIWGSCAVLTHSPHF